MIFGSKLGCLGLEKRAFGKGGIAKPTFADLAGEREPSNISFRKTRQLDLEMAFMER